ncbi:radical SAM family heme chaperone HemW [Aquirufa sp. HETE-83D]|uniref:Heme chaperone HemW n=1 Tax=Aquirufa esocilacus TaxID=3096513 RepID=A0ABW6DP76_9BACT
MHLYLHIPFCRQACHYCDFHFSTNTSRKEEMVNAICREIAAQKDYLKGAELKTIYFGGGTPSLLNVAEFELIFDTIRSYHAIANDAEITLEANPEDLTPIYCEMIASKGINRLSIGIQSFQEKNLVLMNRNHQASDSTRAIQNAQKAGIANISIDLIYGIPDNSEADLTQDLEKATSLGVQHISAYSLTVEPKTVFGVQKKKGTFQEIPDSTMASAFMQVREYVESKGYEGYETSNFAKNSHYSIHNTSYWLQEPYLGIGPSAHSFNGHSRQWNVANNAKYITSGLALAEKEELSLADQYNEYLMVRLRTKWGIQLVYVRETLAQLGLDYPEKEFQDWVNKGYAQVTGENLILVGTGKLLADRLSSDIFVV